MQRVDFYIVESEAAGACEAVVCQLAEKAWNSGLSVFIRAADEAQTARLDKTLWTYRQDSFLPHAQIAEDSDEPILLGCADQTAPAPERGMLINLASTPADDIAPYQRIAEVACREPELLKAARARFRWYRDRGLNPDNHTIPAPRSHRT